MSPSMCLDPFGTSGVVGFKQFCIVFPHIFAAYLVLMDVFSEMLRCGVISLLQKQQYYCLLICSLYDIGYT